MKRGQAAMEFLMTYGWAILVVLAAIGALAYLGVLGPTKLQCVGPADMDCIDKPIVSTDKFSFAFRNNLGYAINITGAEVTGDCTPLIVNISTESGDPVEVFDDADGWIRIPNEQNAIILVNCFEEVFNERVSSEVKLEYTSSKSGPSESATYNIGGAIS